jgi:hypothetical protein
MHGQPTYSPLAPVVTTEMVGCWIDGSHQHPDDFSIAVIRKALEYGAIWDVREHAHVFDTAAVYRGRGQDFIHPNIDVPVALRELSDEAVEWMNDHLVYHHQLAFQIIESDLFLVNIEDLDDDGHRPEQDTSEHKSSNG